MCIRDRRRVHGSNQNENGNLVVSNNNNPNNNTVNTINSVGVTQVAQIKQTLPNIQSDTNSMIEGQDLVSILNQKKGKKKSKMCTIGQIQKQIKEAKNRYMKEKQELSSKLNAQQDNYQLWKGNRQTQSSKLLFPKINTRSAVFNLVNQIY
eukprot:TRINITY_DN24605_c0_g1_i1.p1 TRINITY_DN24605_c0_g1~~TRINITY_DN24605_c0_g1_i1.p1  ORF type:complete len:151 (+),score=28.89 TRINITY_DN24605_c0_g1_i1:176-628(+)